MTASQTDDPENATDRDGIHAEAFTFTYPTTTEPVLRDVSFDVPAGDVLGVLGPVEAGKTTLSMALSSFAPQNTGGVTEGSLAVAGRDSRERADNAVAMVFEDYDAQLTQVRVLDEVVAPLVNRGLPRTDAIPKARELLDRVRLTDVAEKFTWDLSGGQQQRLAIAAALAIDPEVLVFDTATDMLDPAGREEVSNLVASLAGSKTLVVTANDPDDLVGIADHVLLLDGGEQVAFGPADALLRDSDRLRSLGVGMPRCLEVADRLGLDASPLTPHELADALDDRNASTTSPRPASADGGTRGQQPEASYETRATSPANDDQTDTTEAAEAIDAGPGIVTVDGATYEYADGTVAVDGATLDVYDGEVHAVVGGNGAGKSTFSRLLVGLLDPDAGYVRVSGTETAAATARDLATSIGIALQNPDKQLSEETVEDELRFPLEHRQYERPGLLSLRKTERFDDAYIDERVETVCDLVGIEDRVRDLDPMFLPQGEQRLVTIAQALVTDPGAVVLDEPTAGLDAANRATVRETIDRLREDGHAVVLIDHDMDFVSEVADQVSVLSSGDLVAQGPTEEIFDSANWEWLADHHLRPPDVARLATELGVDALTIDGLVDALSAEEVEAI